MTNSILIKTLKICVIFLFCVVGYFLIALTIPYTLPIGLAIFIAICMEPGVQLLERKLQFPRSIASILVLLCMCFLLIGSFILIITEIYDGITYLAELLPHQLQTFGLILEHYFHTIILPLYEGVLFLFNQLEAPEQMMIQAYITDFFSNFAQIVGSFFQELLFSIPNVIANIPESITVIIFVFLASLLISADFPNIKRRFISIIPNNLNKLRSNLVDYFKKATTGYIKAQLILIAVSFHIILIGLFILQVNHALTIALFMLIIDLVPYVGTGILFLPWIIYSFLTGNYTLTIGLAVIYAIVILTRQFIEPKILSVNMGIHPLAWLIAVFLGFKIWGVLGLFIAPFILVFFKSLQHAGVFHSLFRYIMK